MTPSQPAPPAQNRHLLRRIFQLAPSLTYVYDLEQRRNLFISGMAETVLGYTEAEVQALGGRLLLHILLPADLPLLQAHIDGLRTAADGASASIEYRVRHRDGDVRWLRSTDTPFERGTGGLVRTIVGVAEDVTARRTAEAGAAAAAQALREAKEAAEETARAKSVFLSTLSHELRTPLHGILGLAGLLARAPLPAEPAAHLRVLHDTAEHLLAVLNDVLTSARLGAGRLPLENSSFAPGEVLRGCADLLGPQAQARGLRLRLDAAPLPAVLGDAHRLRQVLLNLLGNALKFTERGEIRLRARVLAGAGAGRVRVAFSVRDTGPGIAAAALARIFEPFEQGGPDTERHHGGTGLGLGIARALVQALGGTLGARSRVGAGTTFAFTLEFDLAPAAGPPPRAAVRAPLPPGHALLAEDNPVNCLLVETSLRGWGWTVDVAATGPEAVRLFGQRAYDAVLLDRRLPGLDGLAVAQALRRHPGGRGPAATPIVVLSADPPPAPGTAPAAALQEAGVGCYLTKPFRPDELHAALAALRVPAPLYSLDGVRRLVHYDEAVLQRVVAIFRRTTPAVVQALYDALAAADWPALADAAHHLKNSLDGLRVESARPLLCALEQGPGCPPDPARAAALVGELRTIVTRVLAGLAHEFPAQ